MFKHMSRMNRRRFKIFYSHRRAYYSLLILVAVFLSSFYPALSEDKLSWMACRFELASIAQSLQLRSES